MCELVLRCKVGGLARRASGWGSGGTMLLGITPTVHKLVAQNKPELNLSVMN
jgi:hypothetical protein